jgi:hypothetical protein
MTLTDCQNGGKHGFFKPSRDPDSEPRFKGLLIA